MEPVLNHRESQAIWHKNKLAQIHFWATEMWSGAYVDQ